MNYHIDTGLIIEKIKDGKECFLCEIKKVVEEQFLHEFLNDAVMEDDTRIKVGKTGFCERHFNMLLNRKNKLSLSLQMETRLEKTENLFSIISTKKQAKKQAQKIKDSLSGCVICDLVNLSMEKYYKTVAQMFLKEKDFFKLIMESKGFCLEHYAQLLTYANYAGFLSNEYIKLISEVQQKNMNRIKNELHTFCVKHDYRNANMPLFEAETAPKRIGEKFYGKKYD